MFLGSSLALFCMLSCSTYKLAIPSQFSDNATSMEVKGLGKKYMSFGNFKTSKIKRGWNPRFARRTGSLGQRYVENVLLKNFGITGHNIREKAKGKFQYDLEGNNFSASIFALEGKTTNHLRIKTNNDFNFLNNMNFLKNYEYHFLTTIIPDTSHYKEPWKLLLTNSYKAGTDTSRKLLEAPTGNETGYATDGKDSIFIRPVFVTTTQRDGKKEVRMPVKMLGGYELRWEGGVVCLVDAVKKTVWIYNDLEEQEKFILAAISSAIMLRRVQDIRQ